MDFKGTPKSLTEAINRSLCVAPLAEVRSFLFFSIKDYLAQRFSAAFLRVGSVAEQERLEALWKSIFEEVL